MTLTSTPIKLLSEQFGDIRGRLPGSDLQWLSAMREDGLGKFSEIGWPDSSNESWKYTNPQNIKNIPFGLACSQETSSTITIPSLLNKGSDSLRLVFFNGRFNPNLSFIDNLPKGIIISSLADVLKNSPKIIEPYLGHIGLYNSQPLLALNTAFMNDGFVIKTSLFFKANAS